MLRMILFAGSVSGLWSFEEAPAGRPPEGFEVVSAQSPVGHWVVEEHGGERVLAQTEATPEDKRGRHSFALVEGGASADVDVRARIKLVSEGGQAGLAFRYRDPDNHYLMVLDATNRKIRLVRVVDGNRVAIHGEDDVDLETGVWYELKVRLRGPAITVRMHGLRLFEAKDRSLPDDGRIGFFCDDHTSAYFDDLAVAPIEP
jgi:hypothetical protein